VLENGRIVLEGPADQLAENPRIAQSYLGIAGSRPAEPAPEPSNPPYANPNANTESPT